MTNEKKLEMLAEAMGVEAAELSENMELKEIVKWDSLASINFIVLLDDEFDKQISAGELKGCKTVGDLLELME